MCRPLAQTLSRGLAGDAARLSGLTGARASRLMRADRPPGCGGASPGRPTPTLRSRDAGRCACAPAPPRRARSAGGAGAAAGKTRRGGDRPGLRDQGPNTAPFLPLWRRRTRAGVAASIFIWYPLLPEMRHEILARETLAGCEASANFVVSEWHRRAPDSGRGLYGSGVAVVNPPWKLRKTKLPNWARGSKPPGFGGHPRAPADFPAHEVKPRPWE